MKTIRVLFSSLLLVCLATIGASALTLTFSDQDYLSGASWGTMTLGVVDADTLSVGYSASPTPPIPAGSQATGFGFTFDTNPTTITNPAGNLFLNDQDDLNWIILENLSAIPNPANGDEFSPTLKKEDFLFGATEGNANGINPPGILPGEFDLFYLNFTGVDFLVQTFSIEDFLTVTGVRLQSLPDNINGGSLFLAGEPEGGAPPQEQVPEPGTLALVGLGLAAIGLYRRGRHN